ncbi:glycosyltransferase family 4 protein [Rhodovulum marinum]|uniref:Glycosyltransferase involved in cell wall biosynthesis n=1 Tax=Rhodovulum marinum TaxID=320662 RepID=A0A4R2Q2J4_9RHOB|nr:glycosyltransferase family 1 protein [Rhodovulum marinum]TCP42892.1 glycosyltransferase involved in cell wall biosynthesis [Rhodovulum marinum]
MSTLLTETGANRPREATGPAQVQGDAALPRRILIVSDAWAPQVNGVVRTYENIIRQFDGTDCEMRVIGPADFANTALPSYPEIRLALPRPGQLGAMIERFDPQAIHIPVEGPLGWAARRWCLRNRRAFSTAFHTNFPAYVAVRAPRPLRARAQAGAIAALRRFHAPARFIYVATPALEAQLGGWGFANRCVRLSRGVDPVLFHPRADEAGAGGEPVLLYVGRVAPEKNIEAFLSLKVPGRKVVVGDGPSLPALRAAHPEVTFRGMLVGAPLAEAYRAADVFVFPSRTDTFGNVLLEALASGLALAAYDVPGPRDIIGGDARLGAADDDLGAAVARALASPGTRQDRHAVARTRYGWEKVARDFRRHASELMR